MSGVAPLALVYDRCASRSRRELDMRLTGCHAYADRMGWVLGGRWLDLGDHALGTERPAFGGLLTSLRSEAARREVLCLVHHWGRLDEDATHRLSLQQRIAEAGGWTSTAFGESDRRSRAALMGSEQ